MRERKPQCQHETYKFNRCPRRVWFDGFCIRHHPTSVAQRKQKRRERLNFRRMKSADSSHLL